MKQIQNLTDKDIDIIISILLNKPFKNALISRSKENDFITAEYNREKSEDPRYDYITMEIWISEGFVIENKWNYHNKSGTGCVNEPLYNYQFITKWLMENNFDVFQTELNINNI